MPSQSNKDLGALIRDEISERRSDRRRQRRDGNRADHPAVPSAINLLIRVNLIQCSKRKFRNKM